MTLKDILVPNKYGTVPMIFIPGIGYIERVSDTLAKLYEKGTHTLIEMSTAVSSSRSHNNNNLNIHHYKTENLVCRRVHLVPYTPENILINNAIAPVKMLYIVRSYGMFQHPDPYAFLEHCTLMEDGSALDSEGEPCTLYIEDILYRLDLQGKLP